MQDLIDFFQTNTALVLANPIAFATIAVFSEAEVSSWGVTF
jgi:hypothetical protein